MKTCSKCKQSLPLIDYYANQAGKSWCKKCHRADTLARKARYQASGLCVTGCKRPVKPGNTKHCIEHAESQLGLLQERQRLGKCSASKTCEEPVHENVYCLRHTELKKWSRIQRQYGLSKSEYEAKITAQGSRCPITGDLLDSESPNDRPVVDHCHTTLVTRDILSNRANLILGALEEDPELIARVAENMIAYLAKWKAVKAA